jgi:hypothetical protein
MGSIGKRFWLVLAFMCLAWIPCFSQAFDGQYGKAYRLALKLKADSARMLTSTQSLNPEIEAQRLLIHSLTDMIENLVREDDEPLPSYFDRLEERLDYLQNIRKPGPWARHALAECFQHRAIAQGRYGQNIRAGISFAKAYFKTKELVKDYPDFLPAQKSYGIYLMVVGLMPSNDNFLLRWVGFSGNVDQGIVTLKRCVDTPNAQQAEATLLYCLAQMYIRDQPENGRALLLQYIGNQADDLAAMTLLASVYKEGHQNGRGLAAIKAIKKDKSHLPFYYPLLLEGELYLNDIETDSAVVKLEKYLSVCSRKRLVKQLHFKLFLAYHLLGDSTNANANFYAIGNEGEVGTDGDRYALYFYNRGLIPDKRLIRARLLYDGGYDARAQAALDSINPGSLKTLNELTELQYRRARLAQRAKDTVSAKRLFTLTISTAGDDPSYYAPMSCLQLGRIALAEKRFVDAQAYYERAKTYPKHEYKTGLNERANAGLKRVKRAMRAAEKQTAKNNPR